MTVDLDSIREPLQAGAGTSLVSLDFRRSGQSLGSASVVPSRDGVIGVDRLQDTVIDYIAPALMVRRWDEALAESRNILQENLLKIPRGQ
jgi:hypothetical protein